MAHFAKLNSENIVIKIECVVNKVLTDSNGVEQEAIGIDFLRNLYNEPNANWKKTSYNTTKGVHLLGGTPFRKNHAGIGYTYDETRDAFIPPKPFNSWILNDSTCDWDPPIPYPTDEQNYFWNEENQSWTLQNI